jgi:hypothetical protein
VAIDKMTFEEKLLIKLDKIEKKTEHKLNKLENLILENN